MSAQSIHDLASLVNEATSASSGGSGGSGGNGNNNNNGSGSAPGQRSERSYPPPPTPTRSASSSVSTGRTSNNGRSRTIATTSESEEGIDDIDDDDDYDDDDEEASFASFSRSVARVARAAQGKDSYGGNNDNNSSVGGLGLGRSGSGGSGGRQHSLPPPPPSPRPGPGSIASNGARSAVSTPAGTNAAGAAGMMFSHSQLSGPSASSRTPSSSSSVSGSVRSGRTDGSRRTRSSSSGGSSTRGSGQSNATDRLLNLVNELSRPKNNHHREDPSAAGGAGYLPSQYYNNNNSSNGNGNGNGNGGGGRSSSRSRGGGNSGSNNSYSRASSRGGGGSGNGGSSNGSANTGVGSRGSSDPGSRGSSSLEPTGFVMPPPAAGAPPGPPPLPPGGIHHRSIQGSDTYRSRNIIGSIDDASNSMYGSNNGGGGMGGGTGGTMYSGNGISIASATSAGQSTMPSDYNNGGYDHRDGRPVRAAIGPPVGSGSSGGMNGGSGGGETPYNDSFDSRHVPSGASAPGGNSSPGTLLSRSGEDPSVSSRSFASQPLTAPGYNHANNRGMNPPSMGGSIASGSTASGTSGSQWSQSQYSQSQASQSTASSASSGPSQYSANHSHYSGAHQSSVQGSNQSGFRGGGNNPYQVVQNGFYGDASFASSKGSRSLANSAALIPKAKFSWASESLGTQSTVMTRRSLASASVPEPQQQKEGSKVVAGRMWASFAWILTFAIPNKCIMRPTKDAKQAWREKVALFVMMVSCSVFFVGVFGFVPLLLCKEDTIFSMGDVWLQTGENWVVVHGVIYDVKDLIYRHPGGVKGIVDFLGKDGSKVFPRAPPATLPPKCLDMEKVQAYNLDVYAPDNNFTNPTCDAFSDLDILLGITCHTFAAGSNGTAKFLGDYERGVLSHSTVNLDEQGIHWIALYDRVYDVTGYIKRIRENEEPAPDGGDSSEETNPAAYLTPTLNKVIMNSLGGDATDLYEALFGSSEYIACLEEMFYTGLLDDEFDTFCYTLNIMMYCMLVFVATLMVIQFCASMIYICPRHRTYSEEDVMSPVMIMVPCYNEGDNELRKTIKSVLNTTYPDENKVLFMVADGVVTGDGEDMSTPEHLANILGFDIDDFEDDTFEYDCIGVVHTKNRARVYHGILQKGHKFLKYITVAKAGLPEEATTSAKPGNRGKRDSQLIIMGYYNRIHYGRELTELDSAIQRAMVDLNLQADMVRFLMAIDADTRVDPMSITHMVYGMDKKEKVLALCGETKVDNKASSWVTMIQVFEYYNSHHLKKAFEAAFGCVTCLPGCFTMYRVIADDGSPLLPGDGVLYEYSRNDVETLHEKNLYHLGEDRMLTTLLLKYYPDRSLTFIPEATCWTIVPHTFRILLSQRRRWINSTVHNMFELLKVNTMCGVCCVSMKVVVFIDLIATMILPASYVYAMYLLFLVFFEDLPVSTVLLILYAIIMGIQVVVFILRSRWEYLWWFFVYFTVGLPVFYLILPTYAFWNMDDFSWGKTRTLGSNAAALNDGAEQQDDDDDDEGEESSYKQTNKGYSDLNENDTSVPSAVRDIDDRSTTSSSSSTSGGNSSRRDSDDESGSEYSDSQAESEYFSQASSSLQR